MQKGNNRLDLYAGILVIVLSLLNLYSALLLITKYKSSTGFASLIFALFTVYSGWMVIKQKRWAKIFCFVVSIAALIGVFGFAIILLMIVGETKLLVYLLEGALFLLLLAITILLSISLKKK